ncbi:unnamed protein product [Phytophthora lilii]|uniref:Unnamed protein product n=1 Tax=Phytophthora lilii TaxID=2077276 RepID=A0A9W6XAU7_9STRA|nr:unnamed protein product [Phytophthora lilii]
MDEAYAVKHTQFLGKPVSYVCQNANGPCPLLAIANVLLLRGQLSLDGAVEPPGFVSAHDLMQLVHRRLLDTNPPVCGAGRGARGRGLTVDFVQLSNASELQRLTQEKTLKDVAELLPSMLVGLDVNRLVDYRGVLMTEEANEKAAAESSETEKQAGTETSSSGQGGEEEEGKPAPGSLLSPLATQTTGFQNLSIDVNSALSSSPGAVGSPNSTNSMTSPKKSPSQQTVQTMMKERHISDADALDTATTLLEEGPVLEEFFNSTASQLTYYGLVKLHEDLRERQLCFEGALYLLVTDAGYLDEPSVVWELLNEIDGDTEYLDAQFRPVTSSEQQESILTQQQQQRDQEQEEEEQLRKARAMSLTGGVPPDEASEQMSSGVDTRAAEHAMPSGGLFDESANEDEENLDPDYLLALKFQREEEERVRGNKRVSPRTSPRHLQPVEAARAANSNTERAQSTDGDEEENEDAMDERVRNESSGQDDDAQETSENDYIPVSADGEMMISEEELEAQRQAELYYQERKRQVDAQTRQYQQEQEQLRQQQLHQQQQIRNGQRRRTSEGSDCTIS